MFKMVALNDFQKEKFTHSPNLDEDQMYHIQKDLPNGNGFCIWFKESIDQYNVKQAVIWTSTNDSRFFQDVVKLYNKEKERAILSQINSTEFHMMGFHADVDNRAISARAGGASYNRIKKHFRKKYNVKLPPAGYEPERVLVDLSGTGFAPIN